MKIEEITKAEIHFVTTDEEDYSEYTRYSATNWTVRRGESDEPVYDCKELESMFQIAMGNDNMSLVAGSTITSEKLQQLDYDVDEMLGNET